MTDIRTEAPPVIELRAPDGAKIIGTWDTIPGTALADSVDEDGAPIYDGETDIFWDGQETEIAPNGQPLWIDENGKTWPQNDLVRADNGEPAPCPPGAPQSVYIATLRRADSTVSLVGRSHDGCKRALAEYLRVEWPYEADGQPVPDDDELIERYFDEIVAGEEFLDGPDPIILHD